MKVLVTGASGFVGQSLVKALKKQDMDVVGVGRQITASNVDRFYSVPDFSVKGVWQEPLAGCNAVIHLAARAHVMHETSSNPLAEFHKVNVEGTQHLAEAAVQSGVKRFVYVSSIGVNGSKTAFPLTELEKPNPHNAYAHSKFEAEIVLGQIARKAGLEIVIIRPPLVYGVDAPGNFAQMIKALAKRIPLPLAAVRNLRSLIYVENLVDALILCSIHPKAAGQTYLVSDGEDVSTPELLRKLGIAMGLSTRLFSCSPALLKLVGKLIGKSDQVDRLLGSLQVDSSKIRRELGWKPPFTLDEGLKATAKAIIDKA